MALTGATGFLGAAVARELIARGWRVRALVRRWPAGLSGLGVELVIGDLSEAAALARLVAGVDAVVHVAGAIKGDAATLERANVTGTGLLSAAWRASAPTAPFVHLSSMAAREATLSPYSASKRAGEEVLRAAGGPLRILRPGAIYGPGDLETLKIFRLADAPVQPMLNGPAARVALVHVSDAARAAVDAIDGPAMTGPVEITDARRDGYSWEEILQAATAALGRPMRPFRVPASVLRLVGRAGDGLALLGLPDLAPGSGKVRELLHQDWSPQSGVANRATIGIQDGFRDTVKAYREAGLL